EQLLQRQSDVFLQRSCLLCLGKNYHVETVRRIMARSGQLRLAFALKATALQDPRDLAGWSLLTRRACCKVHRLRHHPSPADDEECIRDVRRDYRSWEA